jgi:hypothetical protein
MCLEGIQWRKHVVLSRSPIYAQSHWRARLALVCTLRVVRKALVAALVVGSVLTLLHQGDMLFSGQITRRVLLKALLTPVIPFCVTLLGAFLNSGPSGRFQNLRPGWAAIRRSVIIATLVGSTIVVLNQGDTILSGVVTPLVLVKILVTPCVPFCVSLYGAYIAYRTAVAAP